MKPVSRTAFYCTGVRALDADKTQPACGDQYAGRFMDDQAWQAFEPFRGFTGPNISNATRHRIKWYAGLAVFSELAVARLGGITAA